MTRKSATGELKFNPSTPRTCVEHRGAHCRCANCFILRMHRNDWKCDRRWFKKTPSLICVNWSGTGQFTNWRHYEVGEKWWKMDRRLGVFKAAFHHCSMSCWSSCILGVLDSSHINSVLISGCARLFSRTWRHDVHAIDMSAAFDALHLLLAIICQDLPSGIISQSFGACWWSISSIFIDILCNCSSWSHWIVKWISTTLVQHRSYGGDFAQLDKSCWTPEKTKCKSNVVVRVSDHLNQPA